MTKHAPATPLPWFFDYDEHRGTIRGNDGTIVFAAAAMAHPRKVEADMPYMTHAAVAYPKLVEALAAAINPKTGARETHGFVMHARALLRELGESSHD